MIDGTAVFKLAEDENHFESLFIANEKDIQRIAKEHRFHGIPIRKTWLPMAIEPVRDAGSMAGEKPVGDCSILYGTMPVFSASAADCLIDLLAPNGELLPMDFLGEPWLAFNVTTIVDVLERSRSELVFFPGTARVMHIDRYAFVPGAIHHAIFKIPERLAVTLVTEEFKNAVLATKLGGLVFREVWRHSH